MPTQSYYLTQPRFYGRRTILTDGVVTSDNPSFGSKVPREIVSLSRTWSRTPGWPNSPKPYPVNPFTYSKSKITGVGKLVDFTSSNINGTLVQTRVEQEAISGYSMSSPQGKASVQDANNRVAYNRLVSRTRDSDFLLPVTLLEMGKTMKMVATTATRMSNAYLALKRGNLSHFGDSIGLTFSHKEKSKWNSHFARDSQKAVASAWLEFSYGWKPLLFDIDEGAKAAASLVQQPHNNRLYVSAKGKASIDQLGTFGLGTAVRKSQLATRYGVWLSPPASVPWVQTLGLTSVTSTVWELIPYSFVVDWFIPVGNFIRDAEFSANPGWVINRGFKIATDYTTEVVKENYWSGAGVNYTYRLRNVRGYTFSLTRSSFSSFSPPSPPRIRAPTSFRQAASAIALLTNLVPSGRTAARLGLTTPKAIPPVMRIRNPLYYN